MEKVMFKIVFYYLAILSYKVYEERYNVQNKF